jgi:hypothetical protein
MRVTKAFCEKHPVEKTLKLNINVRLILAY